MNRSLLDSSIEMEFLVSDESSYFSPYPSKIQHATDCKGSRSIPLTQGQINMYLDNWLFLLGPSPEALSRITKCVMETITTLGLINQWTSQISNQPRHLHSSIDLNKGQVFQSQLGLESTETMISKSAFFP